MRLFLPIGIILASVVGVVVAFKGGDKAALGPVLTLVLLAIVTIIDDALGKRANQTASPAPEKSSRRRRDRVDEQDFILVGLGRIEERLTQLEQRHAALALAAPSSNDKLLLEVRSALASLQQSGESAPAAITPATPVSEDKLGEISGALTEAMKEISRRDETIDVLTANVTRANIQRNLARLTQILEVALSLKARVSAGKSDPAGSLDFLVDDMNAALTDQGVEFLEIAPGTKVSELPAGSFAAIAVVDAPDDSARGTVKEVRSRCYFIPEEGKKPRYVAPAKVVLYRA